MFTNPNKKSERAGNSNFPRKSAAAPAGTPSPRCSAICAKRICSGFGLVETMIAIAIGTAVAVAVTAVSIQGLKDVRGLKRAERLHADAIFFINEVGSVVRQAEKLEVTAPDTLKAILSDKTVIIQKSGNTIALNDGTAHTIVSDGTLVNELRFTLFPRSVRINFLFGSVNGPETFSATTTAAQRNSP